MVVVTNDGWFGQTSGPYQHFAQARLRAVEFGVPMIRAANTGISAVIDPYGRIIAQIGLGITDVLDSPLPKGLVSTAYRRYGEGSFLSLMFVFCCCLVSHVPGIERGAPSDILNVSSDGGRIST